MADAVKLESEAANLALGIAQAVIAASGVPLLLLDDRLGILAASLTFCRTFQIDTAVGLRLPDIGTGEWNVPQLTALLLAAATGPVAVEDYEMTLHRASRPERQLSINAHRLNPAGVAQVMLLLSITDNTESNALEKQRIKLLKEKAILLEELQHRVANSLQIIASVLLQSARGVPAGDSRTVIFDAHSRVMSVASLQNQLALSPRETVALKIYFANLCRSISASMIANDGRLRIDVDVDDSRVPANVSLCLGLTLTELVINALKHAFPGGRSGVVSVSFRSGADGWTLIVRDDGIGMPAALSDEKAGLGSSIVQALASQIDAVISVSDGAPGTVITIRHRQSIDAPDTARLI
jgi:two-component sensor histidine kinase